MLLLNSAVCDLCFLVWPQAPTVVRWRQTVNNRLLLLNFIRGKSMGRPREEAVDRLRASFARSLQKSTHQARRELNIPRSTVWKVLRKRLILCPYRLQLLQALSPDDKINRDEFCRSFQKYGSFVIRFFSVMKQHSFCGKVNRHNVRIGETENSHSIVQHNCDTPKLNFFCAISQSKGTSTWICWRIGSYRSWKMIHQQDGASPHYHLDVRDFLNTRLLLAIEAQSRKLALGSMTPARLCFSCGKPPPCSLDFASNHPCWCLFLTPE
ncbi:hypothetical protein C0J52_12210 [Blattella germanica]|nr:hypothetical protein C0J52_12210 [Blattella germanica]